MQDLIHSQNKTGGRGLVQVDYLSGPIGGSTEQSRELLSWENQLPSHNKTIITERVSLCATREFFILLDKRG